MCDASGPSSPLNNDEGIPARLAEDLSALHPTPRVPGSIDARVLALTHSSGSAFAARRAHVQRRQISRPLRWVGAGAAAAAVAAAVVLAVTLPRTREPDRPTDVVAQSQPAVPAPPAVADVRPGDVNRNGTVDIIDAFELSKKIESAQDRGPRWEDVNGDGVLDKADVDRIAGMAVRVDGAGGNIQ